MSSLLAVLLSATASHAAFGLRLGTVCGSFFFPGCYRIGKRLRWDHKATPFFWATFPVLLMTDYVVPWLAYSAGRLTAEMVVGYLIVLLLLFLDWWSGGPGRRQRKRMVQTVLKIRRVLAHGVPAKRPYPTPA